MKRLLVIPLLVVLAVLMPVSSISAQQAQIDTVAGPIQLVSHNPTAYVASFCHAPDWELQFALLDEELNSFENRGQCVAYVQHGGKLVRWFPDFPVIGGSLYVTLGAVNRALNDPSLGVAVRLQVLPSTWLDIVLDNVMIENNRVAVVLTIRNETGEVLGQVEWTGEEFSSFVTNLLGAEDGDSAIQAVEDAGLPPISLPPR